MVRSAVDARLVDAVLAASTSLIGVAARSMAELDGRVSLVQWRLLVVLYTHGPLPSGRVAGALGTTAPSLSRLADRLENGGLLRRTRSPQSRRVVNLELTEEGHVLVQQVWRRRRRDLRAVLSAVPAAERPQVASALAAFSAAAESYFDGDVPAGL